MAHNQWLRRLACLTLLLFAASASAAAPVIVVETAYPGASAQVLAETVAAPIEQQINGANQLLSMRSRCTNDGRYVLTVAFADGADAAIAQVLVQNRVALALPLLPEVVKAGGVTVKTKTAGVLLIVSLSAREAPFDAVYLSNYAALQIRDELARIAGAGAVWRLPEIDQGLRVWLDPAKLAARALTADDVFRALKEQNLVGKKLPALGVNVVGIDVTSVGRLVDRAAMEDIIVKSIEGLTIRLRDIARVERIGGQRLKSAQLNCQDVALLVIAPMPRAQPRALTQAVTIKLALLEKHLPKGLRLDLAFDFTANVETPGKQGVAEYLLLDVDVPVDTPPDRPAAVLSRCEKLLRDVNGVKDVLTLTDNPFDGAENAGCILVRLVPANERKPSRAEIAEAIRMRLQDKFADATIRVRLPLGAGPIAGWGYPVDLAIHGPKLEQVRKLATALAERMRNQKKLAEVWLDRASELRPGTYLDIDRARAAKLGVNLTDIQGMLDLHGAGAAPGKLLNDLKRLKIRNAEGDMVALSAIVTARETKSAAAVDRLDMQPMVRITANPAPGTSAAEARKLCETLFRAIREELKLPGDYQISASSAR